MKHSAYTSCDELPLIKLVDGKLDRQDRVEQTSVLLAPVPRDDAGALCADEPAFLQLLHILPHGVVAHTHRLADGGVAGMALIGSAVFDAEQVTVDSDRAVRQAQLIDLIGQRKIILDRIALCPGSHLAPPVCRSTHCWNLSLGTTNRLPTRTDGNTSSCISS